MARERDRRTTEIVLQERSRLLSFIRRRIRDPHDAEDVLQEVFCELVEANHRLMPIHHLTGWMFRVARNRIIDLLRRRTPESLEAPAAPGGEGPSLEDLLPSADAGPEALYARGVLLRELEQALGELPAAQREVFVAHELEGSTFKELSAATGVGVNTLLARKHAAVRRLRRRLQAVWHVFVKGANGGTGP